MINLNYATSFICASFTEASNLKDAIDGEYEGRLMTAVAGRVLVVAPVIVGKFPYSFWGDKSLGGETLLDVVQKMQARLSNAKGAGGAGVHYR